MGLKDWASKVFPNGYEEDDGNYIDEEYVDEEPVQQPVQSQHSGYRPAENTTGAMRMGSSSSIEMKVMTPSRFDEVTQIADLVLQKKTVLLNLENTNKETKRRMIDFLSGVAYALNGNVQPVAENTFAITPNNVAVSSIEPEKAPAPAQSDLYE